MSHDSKVKEFYISIINPLVALNVILIFLFIPWIYTGLKFSLLINDIDMFEKVSIEKEKIYLVFTSIFFNFECQKAPNEEDNKFKY